MLCYHITIVYDLLVALKLLTEIKPRQKHDFKEDFVNSILHQERAWCWPSYYGLAGAGTVLALSSALSIWIKP